MLKVKYTGAGRKFIIRWHTHDTQSRLIVANSEKNAIYTLEKIAKKHPDLVIKDFCEIELVAPSDKFNEIYDQFILKSRIDTFYFMIQREMQHIFEMNKILPSIFAVCNKSVPEETENLDEPDQYDIDKHNGCVNCYEKISCSLTREELFHKFYATTIAKHSNYKINYDYGKESLAEKASDNERIWCAQNGFGAELNIIDLDNISEGLRALFLYRKISDISFAELQHKVNIEKTNQLTINKQKGFIAKAKAKLEEEKFMQSIIEIFNG